MSIYHFRPRVVRWTEREPSNDELEACFPGQLQLFGEFEPSEPFGGSLSGGPRPLVCVTPGQRIKIEWDANRGRYLFDRGESFPPVNVPVRFMDTDVTFEGHRFKLAVDCTEIYDVQLAVRKALDLLPIWTSFVLDWPLELAYLRGQIGSFPFNCEISEGKGQFMVTDQHLQEEKIRGLPEAFQCARTTHQRVAVALSYYNNARSLRYIDGNPFRFFPEQITNLAKAIEALCGSNKEKVSAGCRSLGLDEELIERRIIPLFSVRNYLDVAHAAISQPSNEERTVIEEFVGRTFEAVRIVLERAVDGAKDGSLTVRKTTGWSREKKKLVKELSEYIS